MKNILQMFCLKTEIKKETKWLNHKFLRDYKLGLFISEKKIKRGKKPRLVGVITSFKIFIFK